MSIQTTTVRLPELLKVEAETFAASLGISLNALMAVALRDYLDGRTASRLPAPGAGSHTPAIPSPVTEVPPPPAPVAAPAAKTFTPPKSRNAPCPCGARNMDGHALRWKQCHGRA